MNKLRQYALSAFIILVPLCYLPNFTRDAQENFFRYASIVVVAAFIGNIWIGAFLILNVFLFCYSGGSVGWAQVINITFGALLFTFSRYFFSKNHFNIVYKPLLIVTAVTLIFMALQLFKLDPLFDPTTNAGVLMPGPLQDPIGFFGIKEANGTFLTIVLPIVAAVNPIIALLLLLPIKLSQSSGVYLAALTVILFYTWHLHRKIFKWLCFLIPVAGILIIGDLHTDPKTFTARFPVWHSAVKYALRHPIGYGPDSYRNENKFKKFQFVGDEFYNHGILLKNGNEVFFTYYSPTRDVANLKELGRNVVNTKIAKGDFDFWDNPHNFYINILFQYGIIGIILLGGLLREMWLRFKHAIKDKELIVITSSILVYFITGITNFPLELARTAFLFPILLGAFYSKTDEVI